MGALTPYAIAAIEEFPVLRRLVDTGRGVDWHFQPLRTHGGQPLLGIWRVWPDSGFSEAVTVLNYLNARASRCDPYGGEVWNREGDVANVVEGIAELPPPGTRMAPHLVKGSSPSGLWTPGT